MLGRALRHASIDIGSCRQSFCLPTPTITWLLMIFDQCNHVVSCMFASAICMVGVVAAQGCSYTCESLRQCVWLPADGMCEYWGIELTCVVGTCVDNIDDVEYGYYCECGTYEASTWSEDGSPTCRRGESLASLTCICTFTLHQYQLWLTDV